MPKVLITGGTGFVGHWLAQTAPEGFELERMNRKAYYHEVPQWFSDRYMDRYDYVVHLAHVPPSLIIKCARHNKARLLYCSSGIVYHPENDILYRTEKMRWEAECLSHKDIDVVIARLFTFYGEKLDDGKAIVQFIRAAKAGEPLRVWGDGSCIRSYMSGREMGQWLWAILLKGERREAYDVGSDKPVTMLRLAQGINAMYGNKSQIIIEYGKDAMPVYLPTDTAKTRKLLCE